VEADWPALLVLNDARLAGLGEARRGALRGISTALHFHIDFDLGGTLLVDGRSQEGRLGLAGEFGHMPLTGSESPCMCGLRGCWGQEVGLTALARGAGGETGFGRGRAAAAAVLERARGGDGRALAAVRECARALGKGMGYLANACDPERIALSGIGIDLLELAEEEIGRSLEDSQMRFRRRLQVPVVAGELGPSGMVVGAMEAAFDRFLTPEGLRQWLSGP
jgi:predicted NBD/HSP70 family sugar kinase